MGLTLLNILQLKATGIITNQVMWLVIFNRHIWQRQWEKSNGAL